MTLTIGLLGGAGAGKTTAAKYLEQKYGARRYTFAGPLKEFAQRVFNFTDEQVYGTQEQKETVDPRYNVSPRWLLQKLGTEGFRGTFGDDFWIREAFRRINDERPDVAVLEDVRFLNEASYTRTKGYLIRLENDTVVSTADQSHQSEAEWAQCPFDFRIQHDGKTLKLLHYQLDTVCTAVGLTPISML